MNVGETLKHIGTYWEIYEYIGNRRKKLTDIKKHLMKECGKPESTARMQITNFRIQDITFLHCITTIKW